MAARSNHGRISSPETALYRVTARENAELNLPVGLVYAEGRDMMHDRAVAISRTQMFAPRYMLHMVSNTRVTSETPDGEIAASSTFLLMQTLVEGPTTLHLAGSYHDRFVRENGTLKAAGTPGHLRHRHPGQRPGLSRCRRRGGSSPLAGACPHGKDRHPGFGRCLSPCRGQAQDSGRCLSPAGTGTWSVTLSLPAPRHASSRRRTSGACRTGWPRAGSSARSPTQSDSTSGRKPADIASTTLARTHPLVVALATSSVSPRAAPATPPASSVERRRRALRTTYFATAARAAARSR